MQVSIKTAGKQQVELLGPAVWLSSGLCEGAVLVTGKGTAARC
jgi:hypothetical protein